MKIDAAIVAIAAIVTIAAITAITVIAAIFLPSVAKCCHQLPKVAIGCQKLK